MDDHDYVLALRAMKTGAAMTNWEDMARRRAFEQVGADYDEALAELRRTNPTLEPGDEGYEEAVDELVRKNPALAEVFGR